MDFFGIHIGSMCIRDKYGVRTVNLPSAIDLSICCPPLNARFSLSNGTFEPVVSDQISSFDFSQVCRFAFSTLVEISSVLLHAMETVYFMAILNS